MQHFLIIWAPWIVLICAIGTLFIWGAWGKTEDDK
ncbi:hypothetical protein ACFO4N_06115 [Camelliibacillus cellulosilyticus]|uniref:Uncharacterized protein n=1 Tax=Camelliibacillus cellulosilyticus TaxID=2174486 RepID=A0ABV9GMB7_9BACL